MDDSVRVRTLCASERAPKILHVFTHFGVGGTQIGFVRLANHFGRRFEHIVISLNGDLSCASRLDGGGECRLIPIVSRKSRSLSLVNLVHARRTIRQSGADLVVTYNWGSIEWAVANRLLPLCRPHLHVEDAFNFDEINGQKLRRVLFRRLVFAGGTSLIVPSLTLYRIATEVWKLHPSRVLLVPNGVDVQKFATSADLSALPELESRHGELFIGTVSALRPDKRIDRLIRAVAALPPELRASLFIVGGGPERRSLERLAFELGVVNRICFVGDVAAPERVLGLFDIFALSSDTEQMPYAILEAMAAGLPVVATDVGDVRSMVAPENWPFIVRDASDSALIAAIAELARDPRRRRVLGDLNQAKARRDFEVSAMRKRYEALFTGSLPENSHLVRDPDGNQDGRGHRRSAEFHKSDGAF
jgi:L-malate glycosyltransferase